MMVPHLDAAALARVPQPLRQVVDHREIQQGLPAEKISVELLGPTRSSSRSIQPRRGGRSRATSFPRTCCSRAVGLVAVVAGEIALQGGEDGDLSSVGAALTPVEISASAPSLGLPGPSTTNPLRASTPIASRSLVAQSAVVARPIEQRRHVRRDHHLRVGERVHQDTSSPRREAARRLNSEDCIAPRPTKQSAFRMDCFETKRSRARFDLPANDGCNACSKACRLSRLREFVQDLRARRRWPRFEIYETTGNGLTEHGRAHAHLVSYCQLLKRLRGKGNGLAVRSEYWLAMRRACA